MGFDDQKLKSMQAQIEVMRAAAERLMALGPDFPAVTCNARRILASIAMLELNTEELKDQSG